MSQRQSDFSGDDTAESRNERRQKLARELTDQINQMKVIADEALTRIRELQELA